MKLDDIELSEGFTRDVCEIEHFATSDLEIRIDSHDDLERAKPFILASYETG